MNAGEKQKVRANLENPCPNFHSLLHIFAWKSTMKALYLLPERNYNLIYGPDERRDIAARVELVAPRQDA